MVYSPISITKRSRRSTLKPIAFVVYPDLTLIEKARVDDLALIDYVNLSEDPANWEDVSNDFIFERGKKKRVQIYVKRMHEAKINTERKMRKDLDVKISFIPHTRLLSAFGKEICEKVRFFSRLYRQHADTSVDSLRTTMYTEIELASDGCESPRRVNSAKNMRKTSRSVTFNVKGAEGNDPSDESKELLMTKLRSLKIHSNEIETGMPMLSFKTTDDMQQVKRFV